MAKLIETGQHQAVTVPGKLHGIQILRLGQIVQQLVEQNGGWGILHLDIRGGDVHTVRTEISELFTPERIRSTA